MDAAALDRISYLIIQAAIEIHKALGPGLLESAYRTCMIHELGLRNLKVSAELIVPVRYKKLLLDGGYRLDLLVEEAVIVELKSVEMVLPVHRAQLLSYLRLTEKSLGLLINFNVERVRPGSGSNSESIRGPAFVVPHLARNPNQQDVGWQELLGGFAPLRRDSAYCDINLIIAAR